MTLFEALDACTEGEGGVRAAVTYPGRAKMALRDRRGQVFLVDVADEDSKGGSLPGGCIYRVEEGDFEVKCFQWRPAALAGVEVHQ